MDVLALTDHEISRMADEDLRELHRRLHQMYAEAKGQGQATEYRGFQQHVWVVAEMEKRGLQHEVEDELDQETERLSKRGVPGWVRERLEATESAVLVPAYISLVGSATQTEEPHDVDLLVRDDEESLSAGWRESVLLLARHMLDPEKARGLRVHILANAQGPHLRPGGGYIPLYDLVLRPCEPELIEKSSALRFTTLGTGAMRSPRRDACLLLEAGSDAFVFDGGKDFTSKDFQDYPLRLVLTCDPESPEARHMRKIAEELGVAFVAPKRAGSVYSDQHMRIEAHRVEHTNHPTYGYSIVTEGFKAVWAPEFWEFPGWAENADIAFLEAAAWERPIVFTGRVGGHAGVVGTWAKAQEAHVVRVVWVHIGKPTERALAEGQGSRVGGEFARDGQTFRPASKAMPRPIARYTPMKPHMGGYTDFRDLKELWANWGEKAAGETSLYASPKVDGFRTILQRDGDRVSIRFEDLGEERADQLPALVEALQLGAKALIIEGELQAVGEDGRYLARPQLMSMLAGKIQAVPIVFLYDVLYWDGPRWSEFGDNLGLISEVASLLGDSFVALPQKEARTRRQLERAARKMLDWRAPWGKDLPIEGVVVRRKDMRYVFGPTDGYVKLKRYVELKMSVLAVQQTENGFTYEVGLRDDDKIVALGKTFVSKERLAEKGDTLNVRIEELLLYPDGSVAMGKPTPLGVDRSRPAYTVAQAVDLARRFHVLKEIVGGVEKEAAARLTTRDDATGHGEGDTRGAAALRHWEGRWMEAMPISGRKLPFVLHCHWRGLSKAEAALSMDELLKTGHSLHFDLRLGTERFDGWWGITLFVGTSEENRAELRVLRMMHDPEERLESAPKQFGPTAWLKVGLKEPFIVEPGGVGSTTRSYSKFFAIDYGTWRLGMARAHAVEIWLDGRDLRGRFLWQYAPIRPGEPRQWLLTRPADQRPYAETHDLAGIVKELADKGQRWLFWPRDARNLAKGLERIDIERARRQLKEYRVVRSAPEQRYTLGVAYPAASVDRHGDYANAEELERAAWNFLRRVGRGEPGIGLMHKMEINGVGQVVESYIYRGPEWKISDQTVRPGDWLLGVIWDELAWDNIKKGKITGYSIQGFAQRV